MDAGGDKPKRQHKKKAAGVKARKKKEKKTGKVEKHNPRANTFSGGVRSVQRRVQFTLERQAKKDRVPKVDKTPDVPPPFIVVVQGPPGVGKTTLIDSLVKHYCRQRLIKLRGPVTLVSGRHRRLTIIECPQDMSAMLDLAKVADLALLMIDASYGFELETFEFINIMQVHGFPRVIGVLTHLDSFRDNKQLRKIKKTMKHRFWEEIYQGSKLFHMSGLQYGRYNRNEIQNLARFISVQKPPLLSWRQNHPYMLALRWEDHTDPSLPVSAPRRLDLYGYVYGGRLREGSQVHLAGVGDFHIAALKSLTDPCPAPEVVDAAKNQDSSSLRDGKPKKKNALRTLAERHRMIYAPSSDVGSISVDSEAMYIHVPDHHVGFTPRENEEVDDSKLPEAVKLVRELQRSQELVDRVAASRPDLQLVRNVKVRLAKEDTPHQRRLAPEGEDSVPLLQRRQKKRAHDWGADADAEDGNEDDDDDDEDGESEEEEDDAKSDVTGGQGEEDEDEAHKRDVLERASTRFSRAPRMEELIYGRQGGPEGSGGAASSSAGADEADVVVGVGKTAPTDHSVVPLFDDEEEGDQDQAAVQTDGKPGPGSSLLGNLGDPDAVDTTRMPALPGEAEEPMDEEQREERREALKSRKFITGGWSSAEEDEDAKEDAGSDGEAKPAAGKQEEEGKEGAEGQPAKEKEASPKDVKAKGAEAIPDLHTFTDSVPIATFVRLRLEDVPAACVAEFRRERPVLVGALLPGESRMGLVQMRVKRHRWYPKLLKSGDALLLSVGWRRFQTVPTFSLEDRGEKRMRYLKYTLEHAHCTMTAYSPMIPPNSGVLAFRTWNKVGHFRISATGMALESAPNFQIMKKLKLVGEPYKVFRNTAFIQNMFTSDLEVSKYLHTKIQTVSGIRGEIKKAEGTKGNFRATFEDRILMSDIVVCKCWISVQPKEFYHPVIDIARWRPARLIGELRAAHGLLVPHNQDSNYGKKVVRAERQFNQLQVPKKLQAALPWDALEKLAAIQPVDPIRQKTAIVPTKRERQIHSLMTQLQTVRQEKERVRTTTSQKKKKIKEAREKFIQEKRNAHMKEAKKKRYIEQGQKEQKRRQTMNLED